MTASFAVTPNILLAYAASYFCGILSVLVGVFAIFEKQKFTPVYTDMLWDFGAPDVKDWSVGTILGSVADTAVTGVTGIIGGITGTAIGGLGGFGGFGETTVMPEDELQRQDLPNFRFIVPVKMWNPNPYEVTVKPRGAGSGYLFSPDIDVVDATPSETSLDASEEKTKYTVAQMEVDVKTHITSDEALVAVQAYLAKGFSTTLTIFYEYDLDVVVAPVVFWIKVSVPIESTQKCKIELDLVRTSVSEPTCGKTWAEIGGTGRRLDSQIFATNATAMVRASAPAPRRLQTYEEPSESAKAPKVDEKAVAESQSKVDMGLGGMAAFCFAVALCCFVGPIAHFFHEKNKAEEAERKAEEAENEEDYVDGMETTMSGVISESQATKPHMQADPGQMQGAMGQMSGYPPYPPQPQMGPGSMGPGSMVMPQQYPPQPSTRYHASATE
eukprot:CAMPEP_0176023476 /NCGR_PEP_ID=MMETSP0120_2-20121206/11455_1 /TAXON_ID=160619 /ORGANISM="Kryptoperidinium foliaceum, Strain CCMP 1326" /LENGTH=441 /DNA_ID=CAMNT_0017356643 /DNA_START=78 /DNA_END=1403 /DNA_ORIENTATION=-